MVAAAQSGMHRKPHLHSHRRFVSGPGTPALPPGPRFATPQPCSHLGLANWSTGTTGTVAWLPLRAGHVYPANPAATPCSMSQRTSRFPNASRTSRTRQTSRLKTSTSRPPRPRRRAFIAHPFRKRLSTAPCSAEHERAGVPHGRWRDLISTNLAIARDLVRL